MTLTGWTQDLWQPDINLGTRQIEVLRQAARGLTIREAAAETFHSEDTIKYHRKTALEQLGARNISHAVAIAFQEKLLP